MLRFEVECATVPGQHVGVCGSGPLGGWDVAGCLVLEPGAYPVWTGEVLAGAGPVAFKYVLLELGEGGAPSLLRWEGDGPNRCADPRGEGVARMTLRDYFGEAARGTVEVVAAAAPQPGEALDGAPRSQDPGMLGALDVEPSVRFARVVQSPSGRSFGAKYDLDEGAVLGVGMSGGVCLATLRDTGARVAVKTLSTEGLTPQQHEQVLREVQHQMSMDHPGICRLLEVYEEPAQLRLVLEHMRGRDLYDHMESIGHYSERDAAAVVRQMCSAVGYCHRHGVCHRDLKLENFCLEDASDEARVKLIDFGLSGPITALPMTDACGTLYYAAPEVFRGSYNEKCDMWSLGVIAFVLLEGCPPFQGHTDRDTVARIRRGGYLWKEPTPHSQGARDFVRALLQVDPAKRMDAEAALAHPWLAAGREAAAGADLEPDVLRGMRSFMRSNALKRALLSAVAPAATVEEVGRWADQFEAMDEKGCGVLSVQDVARRLVDLSTSKAEAAELSEALAAGTGTEGISYSAFLAACLSTKMVFGERQLRELFDRLDSDADGFIRADEVSGAFGDALDLEELQDDMDSGALSYSDFRWLMQRRCLGPTSSGLRQLLRTYSGMQAPHTVLRQLLRSGLEEEEEASVRRQENMQWRSWHRQALQDGLEPPPGVPRAVAGAAGLTMDPAPSADSQAVAEVLGKRDEDLQKVWALATAEAKEEGGGTDKARCENMAWRKMNMAPSACRGPGL